MSVAVVAATLTVPLAGPAAAAGPCDAPVVNPIACENSKPGNPAAEWEDAASTSIEGFATDMSVNVGGTLELKVNTDASDYRVDVYRQGWYGGDGARKVATVQPLVSLPQSQPACLTESATTLVDCGNWAVSARWTVPADAVSGVYRACSYARTRRAARTTSPSWCATTPVTPTCWSRRRTPPGRPTTCGGRQPLQRGPRAVSYNRPWKLGSIFSSFEESEYAFVRWIERNGYDVSYISGIDTDRLGGLIKNHKVFMSSGHDEYWSGAQRTNVESARDSGVHLAFFSGNEIFWKTRWRASLDAGATPYRTLVCYKESNAGAKIDPSPEWTGTWQDARFSPPSDGGRPPNSLTGQLFVMNGVRMDPMTVPAELGRMRLWRNTSAATLPSGSAATFPAGSWGYEWDSIAYNGVPPAGLTHLSESVITSPNRSSRSNGDGLRTWPGDPQLTLYRAASGALVFGAGTTQWS